MTSDDYYFAIVCKPGHRPRSSRRVLPAANIDCAVEVPCACHPSARRLHCSVKPKNNVMRMSWKTLLLGSVVAAGAFAAPTSPDQQYLSALKAVQAGQEFASNPVLENYPLRPYLDYFRFNRALQKSDPAQTKAWIERYAEQLPVAGILRSRLLANYAQSAKHSEFLAIYRLQGASATERCQAWNARMALSPNVKLALKHALALYRDLDSPNGSCQRAFQFLREHRALSEVDSRARFEGLVARTRLSDAAAIQVDLPANAQRYAKARLLAERDVAASLKLAINYPADNAEMMSVLVRTLERVAENNPALARMQLAKFVESHRLGVPQQEKVQSVIARVAIIANSPGAGAWLDNLAPSARDQQTHEWGVRRALSAMQPELALSRIQAMPASIGETARWRFVQARTLQWLGQHEQAQVLLTQAAKDNTFYGFLSADRIVNDYALCPNDVKLAPKIGTALQSSAAMQRIAAFKRLGDRVSAKREWMFLIGQLTPEQKRQAGLMAALEGWGEYAILALNSPEDRTMYEARFPLLQAQTLNAQAQVNGLDAAFVAGLIRQESAWDPQALSHAKAMGLMQLLPSTAAITAKSIGFTGKFDLYNAEHNLRLGTAHLGHLSSKYAGSPILMTAAYNAGPNAVARWKNELYQRYPDLWLETIPYKETREYVTSVLAFSVIYDWRLDGKLQRLSSRIPEFVQVSAPVAPRCMQVVASNTSGSDRQRR